MSRSKWKYPFIDSSILNILSKKNVKVWSRSSTIPFFLIGKSVLIHNGKDFKRVLITRDKVGFKFGEFSLSRKNIIKNKIINKKQIKK